MSVSITVKHKSYQPCDLVVGSNEDSVALCQQVNTTCTKLLLEHTSGFVRHLNRCFMCLPNLKCSNLKKVCLMSMKLCLSTYICMHADNCFIPFLPEHVQYLKNGGKYVLVSLPSSSLGSCVALLHPVHVVYSSALVCASRLGAHGASSPSGIGSKRRDTARYRNQRK